MLRKNESRWASQPSRLFKHTMQGEPSIAVLPIGHLLGNILLLLPSPSSRSETSIVSVSADSDNGELATSYGQLLSCMLA